MTTRRRLGLPTPTINPVQQTQVLRTLKESTEVAQRRRGNKMDSFVRLDELVALGLADQFGNLTPTTPIEATLELKRLRALLRFRGT